MQVFNCYSCLYLSLSSCRGLRAGAGLPCARLASHCLSRHSISPAAVCSTRPPDSSPNTIRKSTLGKSTRPQVNAGPARRQEPESTRGRVATGHGERASSPHPSRSWLKTSRSRSASRPRPGHGPTGPKPHGHVARGTRATARRILPAGRPAQPVSPCPAGPGLPAQTRRLCRTCRRGAWTMKTCGHAQRHEETRTRAAPRNDGHAQRLGHETTRQAPPLDACSRHATTRRCVPCPAARRAVCAAGRPRSAEC